MLFKTIINMYSKFLKKLKIRLDFSVYEYFIEFYIPFQNKAKIFFQKKYKSIKKFYIFNMTHHIIFSLFDKS